MTERDRKRLVMLTGGQRVGEVEEDEKGRLTLTYDDAWRSSPTAIPVSLSLPLAHRSHDDAPVRAFLWNLLPDNEHVLERWARTYHVSAGSPFALLRHVGEDCAGAIQFAVPDRVSALLDGDGGVRPVDEVEIAQRLRTLRRDPSAWHLANTGQFSLAGAQAKTALHYDPASGRWGDPWGAVPTTHILKPTVAGFDNHDLNEHLCLRAARLVGLPAARSRVMSFGAERAIVVERYDRVASPDGAISRVHQEDTCQALGLPPTVKYQSEGGPGPEQIIQLLRREVHPAERANDEVARFVDLLAFNWIIAGTDAHAKNYSLLHSSHQVRLSPAYDVASALPYDDMYLPKLRLAMRIGGEYRIERIVGRHWRRFAVTNDLDPDEVLRRVDQLAARVPEGFARAAQEEAVRALGSDLPAVLVERVTVRAARCRAALAER